MVNGITVKELHEGRIHEVPNKPGIYYFCLPEGFNIEILPETEGLKEFRKYDIKKKCYVMKQSRYNVSDLEKRINQYKGNINNDVLYIGSATDLHERISLFLDFRFKKEQGHFYHSGGRSIWQIKNNKDLIVSWNMVDVPESSDNKDYVQGIEKTKILEHIDRYGCKPFANRKL